MRTSSLRRLVAPALLAALALADAPLPCAVADGVETEPFPPASASAALPAELVRGPHHTVREPGVTEDFLTRWEMESPFGLFVCPSRRMLEVRAHEAEAIARVVDSDGGSEFLRGLKGALVEIPTTVVKILEDPRAAAEGVAKGVERTFGRVGDLFSKRRGTKYEDAGPDDLLFSAEKRKVAAELGVDVYSSNPKLQKLLGDIAKARRAGGFAVDLGKMAIPGGAGLAVSGISMTASLTDLLRDHTPAELDRLADERMAAAGVPPPLRQAFLANRVLSPRHRTSITLATASLARVADVGALIAATVETRSEALALLHEQQALFLVDRHVGGEPFVRLDATGGLVAAFTASGRMIVPAPVDVVALTPELVTTADGLLAMPGAAAAPTRTMWSTGTFTPKARAYLEGRGFTLVERGVLATPGR